MSTKFYFFDQNGKHLFQRDDAIEFEHYCETLSFEGIFPLDSHTPEAGMLIGWLDDDDLWEVHEISTGGIRVTTDGVEVSGSHLAKVELGAVVATKMKFKNKGVKDAVTTILAAADNWWQVGVLPSATEDDALRQQRYRVTSKQIKMYADSSTSAKVISKYKKKKYLTPVQKVSTEWWQMEGADGRVGWIRNPESVMVRDGNAGDEDKFTTVDERFISVWELLTKVQAETGYIITPRVTIDDTGISGRYIDVRTGNPDYRGVRLTCTSNISDGAISYNMTNVYTALVGVGKDDKDFHSVTWTVAGGFPVDKPSGQYWVGLPDALTRYGHNGHHRMGVVYFDEEDNAGELLRKTYDYLTIVSLPEITVNGTIADLYQLGYGGQSMRLYDKVQVILDTIGRRVEMRITGLTRDLVRPENTQPVIGTLNNPDLVASLASAAGSATSIQSWQLTTGAVGTTALLDGSVNVDKIAAGAVIADAVAANAITAEKISSGAVTTEKLDADAVTANKIDVAEIVSSDASIDRLKSAFAEIVGAYIEDLSAQSVTADRMGAALANFQTVVAGTAEFDAATIKHLVSSVFNLTQTGTAEDLYIYNLRATFTQVMEGIFGRLVVKGDDGRYYELHIDSNGIRGEEYDGEIDEEHHVTEDGTRKVLDSVMPTDKISAGTINAVMGVINQVFADMVDTDVLLARQAFVTALYTSKIFGGKSLEMLVGTDDNITAWFRFGQNGLAISKPDSAWETVTDANGYHIRNKETAQMVGSFERDRLISTGIQIGDILCKRTSSGGWVWTDA